MKMFNVKKIVGAVVACGLAMAYAATPAHASIQLKVTDGLGINFNSGPVGGTAVSYTANVDGWDLTTTIGHLFAGDPPTPNLDLGVIGAATTSGNDLDIYFSENGESTSPVSFFGKITHNSDANVTFSAWADSSNVLFGTGTTLFTNLLSPDSITIPFFSAPGPYSVTMKLHVTQTVNAGYSDDARLRATVVPEPASLMMLGTGLVAFGRTIRRRMRKA